MSEQRRTLHLDPNAGGAAFRDDDREPEVNADLSRRVVVDTARMPWQSSPASGVRRKRLELLGSENPRLTTVVSFAPGSRFAEHGHPGGEEFLVLSGTFTDHSGDFQAGSYVRNPSGWVHAPWTEQGCELFVKLRQFQDDDQERVIVQTGAAEWLATEQAGLSVLPLHAHHEETVALYQLAVGTEGISMDFRKGAEIFLLEGECEIEGTQFTAGTWLRFPIGTRGIIGSKAGCRFYGKTGRPYA